MTNRLEQHDLESIVQELLATSNGQITNWLEKHRRQVNLSLLKALREYCLTFVFEDPHAADKLTRQMRLLAENMPDEPIAQAVANWARAIWAQQHVPLEAVQLLQAARNSFRSVGDELSVAKLSTNMVAALTECGRFNKAEEAYNEARPLFVELEEQEPLYLLRLEQNYGWLLHNQGRYEESLEIYERCIALARRGQYPVIEAEIQVNRTVALALLGRLAEGEAALLRDRDVAEHYRQTLTVARIDMILGELYIALGEPAAALNHLHLARDAFAQQGNDMEVGSVFMREAALFQGIGTLRDAQRCYAEAYEVFTKQQMLPQVGQLLIHAARVSRRRGRYAEATTLLDEANKIWQRLDQTHWLATVRLEQVMVAVAQADVEMALTLLDVPLPTKTSATLTAQRDLLLAEVLRLTSNSANLTVAHDAYQRSLAYARTEGNRWLQRRALAGLGKLLLDSDIISSLNYLEEAAEQDDAMRQALSVQELKASYQSQAADLFPLMMRIAIQQDEPARALSYIWRAKGSALVDLLEETSTNAIDTSGQPEELQQARQELAAHRWRLAMEAMQREGDNLNEAADNRIRLLEQRISDLRRRRNRREPDFGAEQLNDPVRFLTRLNADALIEYMLCEREIWGVYAARDGIREIARLADSTWILDLLDQLHLSIQNVISQSPANRQRYSREWLAECKPLLQTCYELLVAPLVGLDFPRRLLIAPCEPLYQLPFAAFWNGENYLTEISQIETIPTGALLAVEPPPAVATGPPVFIGNSVHGLLRAVHGEGEGIRFAFPDSVLLIDSPQALKFVQGLDKAPRYLHIAAHSILREDAPLFTALQLEGATLSVEQCYELPLQGTELVVLSGCTTSSGLDTGGALLAFQTAFFAAGARRVLSTSWPIDDEVAARWMRQFYQHLAGDLSPVAALQRTQQTFLADPHSRHPALWAMYNSSSRY